MEIELKKKYICVNKNKNKMKKTTFKVTYTKAIGGNGSILVIAENEQQAISRAKGLCATGTNFRDAILTNEKYTKPRKQGFAGFN